MDAATLFIQIMLMKSLVTQRAQYYDYCMAQQDPAACYDTIPPQFQMPDMLEYEEYDEPRYTPGQFYHYIPPEPFHSASSQACSSMPATPASHCR